MEPAKILFIAASGIGNTILATPLIQRTRDIWPKVQIDLLTSRKVFQAPLTRSGLIRQFFDLQQQVPATLFHLRREKYDVSFNCFPSNRWQFNVVAGLVGATLRLTHAYTDGNRMSSFMNRLVPANEALHDIEQNLQLLTVVSEAKPSPAPPIIFATDAHDEQKADAWLNQNGLAGKVLIGVHAGGTTPVSDNPLMNRQIGAIKSPRHDDLCRELAQQPADAAIIFFGGPEEEPAIETFRVALPSDLRKRCHRYCSDLWSTACLVKRCRFFISGDTALMHIAAVFQVPQKAYFLATNPSRTAPRNPHATLAIEKGCASYRYPFSIKENR